MRHSSLLLFPLFLSFSCVISAPSFIIQQAWNGYSSCSSTSEPAATIVLSDQSCLQSDPTQDVKVFCEGTLVSGYVCTKTRSGGIKPCQSCETNNKVTMPTTCQYDSKSGTSNKFSCTTGYPKIYPNVLVTKHAEANSSCNSKPYWSFGPKQCIFVTNFYLTQTCNATHQLVGKCTDSSCNDCTITATNLEFDKCYPPGSPTQKPYEDQSYACGKLSGFGGSESLVWSRRGWMIWIGISLQLLLFFSF